MKHKGLMRVGLQVQDELELMTHKELMMGSPPVQEPLRNCKVLALQQ
jgi:hypothetical protein